MSPFAEHVQAISRFFDQVDSGRMLEDGYDGFFSLEWEKKWHPELPPVEDALERYVRLMKG